MQKSKYLGSILLLSTFMLILAVCGNPAGTTPGEFFTVSFAAYGGEPEPEAQLIPKGGLISLPEDMTRSGNKFDNWYKDEECTEKWDFEKDVVLGDITLYAKWNPAGGGGVYVEYSGTFELVSPASQSNVYLNTTGGNVYNNGGTIIGGPSGGW